MAITLPLPLRTALEAGECTLFLGSGIGRYARDAAGEPGPTGAELAAEVAYHFNVAAGDQLDLSKISQVVVARHGRPDLESFLSARLASLEPTSELVWLLERTWSAIFTTNYDRLLQRAYEQISLPSQTPVSISCSADVVPVDPRFEVPIFHLHGSLFEGSHPYALITTDDYAEFREHRRMLFDVLKTTFATRPILYIGYSNNDPNWAMTLSELKADFSPASPPQGWRVALSTSELDKEVLRTQGVETLDASLDDFVEAYRSSLGDLRVDPSRLDYLQKRIPSDLQSLFAQQPAAVARLVASWEYVNQADFVRPPNVSEYLKGDPPSWSLVEQDIPFERDVEEEVLDALLDFATSTESKVNVGAVLSPAGYGTTTVLMRLAVRLVRERAGTVLFLRDGTTLIEGDVEFAAKNLPQPLFLIVDNAADAGQPLVNAVARLRAESTPAYVLLGERLNEWVYRKLRLSPRQFGIDPLSEAEIQRLLEKLERHSALGALADLPATMRVAAVRERNSRELLVTMREVTEGRAFDAIIESEYWDLGSDLAREIYATVCGISRVRALARDTLVSQVVGCDLIELFDDAARSLEGVVRFDVVDEVSGTHAARARHHVIAKTVWEKCVGPLDQERLLLRVLAALNLNYAHDAKAFENLYRSDQSVDSFTSPEARIEFFEIACRKAPRSPFVRQHFARLLRREKRYDEALEQVRIGLEFDNQVRSLHHTMGTILADMVFDTSSKEIARRRFANAEAAFQKVLEMNPRDDYGYQSLAQLHLDWARDVTEADESAEHLRKSEEVIARGMARVSDRESLWIVSANVAEFVGDSPEILRALEKAIKEKPDATVARYLLSRHYLENGRFEEAETTARPGIEANPEDHRLALVTALALHRRSGEYGEAIAIMHLAETPGRRHARFVATYGGMLLMSGKSTQADEWFRAARDSESGLRARTTVEFRPGKAGEPIRLRGSLETVRAGFSFIRVAGMPDFYCPRSRFSALDVPIRAALEFTPAFSVRGGEAEEVVTL